MTDLLDRLKALHDSGDRQDVIRSRSVGSVFSQVQDKRSAT